MFQPETEDMLPRMAPKPIPDVINGSNGILRPQVPEVSILFGQQEPNIQQQLSNNHSEEQKEYPQQTYAAWKKQMLPKVTFPASAVLAEQLQEKNMLQRYNCATTNIQPIRLNSSPVLNVALNQNALRHSDINDEAVHQLLYTRSLESCNNMAYKQTQSYPIQHYHPPLGSLQPSSSRLPQGSSEKKLTICAGTQTERNFESTNNLLKIQPEFLSSLATKKDVENVLIVLDELKVEQQRILKILETVLLSHRSQMALSQCRDVGVQADFIESNTYANIDHPKNKFIQHLKTTNNLMQTPKGKPVAQSTTYRPNSPQFQTLKQDSQELMHPAYKEPSKPKAVMHKSSSDTSLVMNELALKYLPNEKLTELLKELNMDCPLVDSNAPTIPNNENYDKYEKGPSDISNASYKYLKKYRLLPEDVENHKLFTNKEDPGELQNGLQNQNKHHILPLYNIENTPTDQRQAPINKCSPYAGCLPLSPLTNKSSPLQTTEHQLNVNLENIKHQPKFL